MTPKDQLRLMNPREIRKMLEDTKRAPERLTLEEWNQKTCHFEGCFRAPEMRMTVMTPGGKPEKELYFCLTHYHEYMAKIDQHMEDHKDEQHKDEDLSIFDATEL